MAPSMTPTQARYRLVLSVFRGPSFTPTEAERAFYSAAGAARGLSTTSKDPEVVDATVLFAFALALTDDTLSLDAKHRVVVLAPPTHMPLIKDRLNQISRDAIQGADDPAARKKRIQSWLPMLQPVDRPWRLDNTPDRWVSIGFLRASPLIPEWMKNALANPPARLA